MNIHTLVIGIGNTLRGDDGIGYLVAEQLSAVRPPHVSVIATYQLLPEHIDDVRKADRVVFVDASFDLMKGHILQKAIVPAPTPQRTTHHMTPEQVMWHCWLLFDFLPEAQLLMVGIRQTDEVCTTSPSTSDMLHNVLDVLLCIFARQRRSLNASSGK